MNLAKDFPGLQYASFIQYGENSFVLWISGDWLQTTYKDVYCVIINTVIKYTVCQYIPFSFVQNFPLYFNVHLHLKQSGLLQLVKIHSAPFWHRFVSHCRRWNRNSFYCKNYQPQCVRKILNLTSHGLSRLSACYGVKYRLNIDYLCQIMFFFRFLSACVLLCYQNSKNTKEN